MKNNHGKINGVLILILIIIAIVVAIFIFKYTKTHTLPSKEEVKQQEVKKVSVVDLESKSRPFGVMINNYYMAREHHQGLQDAYIIYEMIVEGGITRYLALYKDQATASIGSVRSARHYFIDYALENDAYYVHFGGSPIAYQDIKELNIDDIDGFYSDKYFYRDKDVLAKLRESYPKATSLTEHTAFTNMDSLNTALKDKKYRDETNKKVLLKYSVDPIDLSTMEDSKKADEITVKYSNSVTNKFVYDQEKGYYLHSVNDKAHVDDLTNNQYHFKNIITYQVENHTITGDDKERQDFKNVGSGEGYFITNGYAVKIKWSKPSRSEQTKYTFMDGKELTVSDGNTFIEIQPKGQTLKIESGE